MARGKRTPLEKKELIKSLLLVNPDMSSGDIARQTDVPARTVRDIMHETVDDADFAAYRQNKKIEIIKQSLEIATSYITHLAQPEVIEKASARDSAIVAGTMIDKAQLLSGEATVISERRETIPELMTEFESKLAKLKKMVG